MRFVTPLASACSLSMALFCLTTTGCSKGKADSVPSTPSEQEATSSKAIEPMKIPDDPAAKGNAPTEHKPTTDVRQMTTKMQYEAAHRPKAGVTAEVLFDALEANAGIKLQERRQYVGSTMHASFCAGGLTTDHVTVAMCEYPDDKAAQAGLDYMNQYFNFPDAHREMHHAAVMTVIAKGDTAGRVDKAFKAFAAL